MKNFFQRYVTNQLKNLNMTVCQTCGSLWTRSTGLCNHCWIQALVEPPFQLWIDEISTRGKRAQLMSLTQWTPNGNPTLSTLITSLKGGNALPSWEKISAEFILRWGPQIDSILQKHGEDIVIIPAPSKVGESFQDHAYEFSFAMGYHLGIDVMRVLKRSDEIDQKKKGIAQRATVHFDLIDEDSLNGGGFFEKISKKETLIIFVDDILTTGGTARASFEALAKIRHPLAPTPMIWVLAYRKQL